jgi:glutamine amidotransferase
MNVAIIDYGSGNLRSAAKAFEYAAAATGHTVRIASSPEALREASHIVLPGVGAFADCMHGLEAVTGMRAALEEQVMKRKKPFLGICVGMQMLFETGYEHGTHKGLGWLKGEVVKIGGTEGFPAALKIPHMGWNDLTLTRPGHPLLNGIADGDHAYFVHSYHAVCDAQDDTIATTDYGGALAAIVAHGNIMGTQFHPEKSQQTGLKLIGNFLRFGSETTRRTP